MSTLLIVTILAFAQEPPQAPEDPREEDADATIVVYGDDAIREARARVVADLAPLGWEAVDKGDRIVFRPPRWWLGRARLYDDGRFAFGRAIAPLQGGDLGFAGMAGGSGARPLPARVCDTVEDGDATRIYRGHIGGLDGEHVVEFAIYGSEDDETSLWTERQTVPFADGAFVAVLGHQHSLTDLDLETRSYWIVARVPDAPPQARVPLDAVTRPVPRPPQPPCSPAPAEFDPFAPQVPSPSAVATAGGTVAPSRKRLRQHHQDALEAIADDLRHYRAVIAETALQARLATLPDELDALWRDGTPLYGEEVLQTPEDRRAAVLELWATRADNRPGRAVSAAIEAWLEDAVIYSDHPITEAEYATWEARRPDGRKLPRP